MPLSVVILAAGRGRRMHSESPKVLHLLAGRPLLWHVWRSVAALKPRAVYVVHSGTARTWRAALDQPREASSPEICWVAQKEALGTGHAARLALEQMPAGDRVLVLCGDTPLLRPATLHRLLEEGVADGLTLLSAVPAEPTGYGRLRRDSADRLLGIVEEADATPRERELREVSAAVMTAPAALLRRLLEGLKRTNAQGEYYLGDVVGRALGEGLRVDVVRASDAREIAGVNTHAQLAVAERTCRRRRALELMEQGLTLLDPERFDLRGELHCGRDVLIDINVVLEGEVHLGDGVRIGAHCCLRDVKLEQGVRVLPFSLLEEVWVGRGARLGPYCRVRPGTRLEAGARIGNFVELKNSRVGSGARVNHLSYVGDSEVGPNANVGAGVITCNYDGRSKHRTAVGAGAFIGSGCQLVAPVKVGAGATVAAGTTVTRDVLPGSLAIGRTRQRNVADWHGVGASQAERETDNGRS